MRRSSFIYAAALLAALPLVPCAATVSKAPKATKGGPARRDEAAAVRAAFERLVRAFRERDARAVMALIAEDALLNHAGLPDKDYRNLGETFGKMLAPRPDLSEAIEVEVEELRVSGDMAFLRITWRTKWELKGSGRSGSSVERDLEIWRRQRDGSWKLSRGLGCRLAAPAGTK